VIPPIHISPNSSNLNTVMDRDRRLTRYLRGQVDNPAAPAGFELNNPWRVRIPCLDFIKPQSLT
jgi:hypothetical protein